MKISLLITTIGLLILLVLVSQFYTPHNQIIIQIGGLPWFGWAGIILLLVVLGFLFLRRSDESTQWLIEQPPPPDSKKFEEREKIAKKIRESNPMEPDYPHPVIIGEKCIACNRCIEACPHDVLAMVDKYDNKGPIATVVAPDLCMEDTSCEAVCPVSPKACVVINSTKEITVIPTPKRDSSFMTNIKGCYVIGDVSGAPLIKNAVKEGAEVITYIKKEMEAAPPILKTMLDVIIVGLGPAGLSAVLAAKREKLKFLGLERETILATIQGYPKNKYVHFKPQHLQTHSDLRIDKDGEQRENLLTSWLQTLAENGIKINRRSPQAQSSDFTPIDVVHESETCIDIQKAADGDYFILSTEVGQSEDDAKGKVNSYLARRVIIAIGLLGEPKRLKNSLTDSLREDDGDSETPARVNYKVDKPRDFRRKRIIVIGGGNAAIETAVDFVARRIDNQIEILPDSDLNKVTLLVRSNFTNDVKFENKQQLYYCRDKGHIDIRFNSEIAKILDHDVIIGNSITHQEEFPPIPNDYIFVKIGGEPPNIFLKKIGIQILNEKKLEH